MRKRNQKVDLNKLDGVVFYSKTYNDFVVFLDGSVHCIDLDPFIDTPTDAQIRILAREMDSYLQLRENISISEFILTKFKR